MSFFICAHTLHSVILLRYEVQASSVTSDYTKHTMMKMTYYLSVNDITKLKALFSLFN